MDRSSTLPLRLIIPVVAAASALLLSSLPWEHLQRTYLLQRTLARWDSVQTDISLSGMEWPEVKIAIVQYEDGAYVRVMLQEKETEESDETEETDEVTLMVPVSWELQETSGVPAWDIRTRNVGHGTKELTVPRCQVSGVRCQTALLFKTSAQFDALRFVHDSPFPALFTVSHATFPEREMRHTTHFVKEMRVIEL